jgi:hypothetical protein
MSVFTWFSKKSPPKPTASVESSGLGHTDATIPFRPSTRGRSKASASTHPGSAGNRKGERLERRELLYTVVRESMTSVGVLSTGYKFKVLSLDSKGVQYLIMMDLSRQYVDETGRLAEIESLIAQNAKSRYGILVTAVYWRINEHVTAGVSRPSGPVSAPAPLSRPAPLAGEGAPTAGAAAKPHYEPLEADEVEAFKKALASVPASRTLSAPGEIVRSGRRNPHPEPVFANTELDERQSPLSGTQYGDLN